MNGSDDSKIRSWRDENGVLRCDRTVLSRRPAVATLIAISGVATIIATSPVRAIYRGDEREAPLFDLELVTA